MTVPMDNWCEVCEEACHDHPSLCTVCGSALGPAPPPQNSNGNGNRSNSAASAGRAIPEGFLDDLRDANRDLQEILGSLRGQVQDLDALTRGFLQQQQQGAGAGAAGAGEWQTIPAELLNPSQSSSHRPTSKQILEQIPRVVLTEKSALFRHATLVLPIRKEQQNKNFLELTCVMGEFGPVDGEWKFEESPIVVCSPLTGKGGELSSSTARLISHLSSSQRRKVTVDETTTKASSASTTSQSQAAVIAFLQRGDDVTFVQKAMLAQEAGASAVVIGNNTSIAWPYVMKDSKNEAQKLGLKIPVAMIKEEDSKQLLKLYKEYHQEKQQQQQQENGTQTSNSKTSAATSEPEGNDPCFMTCNLCIEKSQSKDCVVCCEKFAIGDTVMQLPDCGHVFHSSCALAWLKGHNTCPYCRRELETDDTEYERERRRQQRTHAGSSNVETSLSPSPAAEAFYG